MEKLRHLEEDSEYFNRCVKDLDWEEADDRAKIYTGVKKRYDAELARDLEKLFDFYTDYQSFIAWDLHGDSLMERINTGEIVILDPYTRKAWFVFCRGYFYVLYCFTRKPVRGCAFWAVFQVLAEALIIKGNLRELSLKLALIWLEC